MTIEKIKADIPEVVSHLVGVMLERAIPNLEAEGNTLETAIAIAMANFASANGGRAITILLQVGYMPDANGLAPQTEH